MSIKITAIGGGTGLSTLLSGLKEYSRDITAIVTVADDGGSSGILRDDLGMAAPGDVRNCLNALADSDLKEIINYRFTEGSLAGHSFGNLCLAALNQLSGTFEEAVSKMNRLFEVSGRVIPVTNESVVLKAVLKNGKTIVGEHNIGSREDGVPIERVELYPPHSKPADGVLEALSEADIIVFGPGSLYTSIIPNLLVDGVTETIKSSSAVKVYVCNIMTQNGETSGYSAYEHLRAIEEHTYPGIMDYVIVNDAPLPEKLLSKYRLENSEPVAVAADDFAESTAELIRIDAAAKGIGYVRHDVKVISEQIIGLLDK